VAISMQHVGKTVSRPLRRPPSRLRHGGGARRSVVTTILTTNTGSAALCALVRLRAGDRFTCGEGLRRTVADPRPAAEGQRGTQTALRPSQRIAHSKVQDLCGT
jgi:hypothetical protein